MRLDYVLYDDFFYLTDGDLWTKLASEGTVAVGDSAGGIVVLTATNTNNNEVCLRTTKELTLFADDKPFYAECRLQYAEASTNQANVAFGLADAFGSDLLLDNGAGPSINSSGALIYKVDGGTVWKTYGLTNSVSISGTSDQTAGGTSYCTLGIKGRPVDGTSMEFTWFMNGQPLTNSSDSNHRPIQQRLAYASATEMRLGVYLKTGSATQEVVNVDYMFIAGRRATP